MTSSMFMDEARALLADSDIAPMSAIEEAEGAEEDTTNSMPESQSDIQCFASAEEAVAAAEADALTQLEEVEDPEVESRTRVFDEGSVGLGVDIVEIERMERILARKPHFAEQVFSSAERDYCDSKARPATHYALRFAAKEAVVKALGTGFSEGIRVRDIEIDRAKNGQPLVKLSGVAETIAAKQGVRELSISLSYTHTDAVACAMAITEGSIRATEKRKDPMEELSKKFKETRKMLDEL